jgi:aminopeptidase N
MSGTALARTTSGGSGLRRFVGLAFCWAVMLLAVPAVAAPRTGAGEPFFPHSGTRAYDVLHYDVQLSYRPDDRRLRATATIEATPTETLSRFSLDLDDLRVTEVLIAGAPVGFSHKHGKLVVDPTAPLEAGRPFVVVVRYGGTPEEITDPDGTTEGWIINEEGAAALGEPSGTASWLPCNNTPRDKASFGFHLTVPTPLKAVANGQLQLVSRSAGQTTFDWSEAQPMAPYLATVDIGPGKLTQSTIAGVPAWLFVDSFDETKEALRSVRALPQIIAFESHAFGPYPFDSAGSIVNEIPADYAALETQTRPTYAYPPDRLTVVHEMAHQWFGDSVSLTRWPDIWLNEGFATWAEWFYAEHQGGPSTTKVFRRLYRTPASDKAFWDPPSGRPGTPEHLFGTSVYVRGGLTLEALRMKVGTATLLTILRGWAERHRYGNATIPDFIALAEEVSGRKLHRFFDTWLYKPGKPRGYAHKR